MLAAVLLIFALLTFREVTQKHDIGGSIAVLSDSSFGSGSEGSCTGASVSEGYGDIGPGIDVVVRNKSGSVIATGQLETGKWLLGNCVLPIRVPDVPSSEFYSLKIGHRGEQNFSKEEMEKMNWEVSLSIGP